MKLKSLNTLITGGSQGLGRVIAEHFLAEGANIILCARGEKELFATRDELAKQFPSQKVLAKTCDVSNEAQVNDLVAFTLRELGPLHALVLNAGVYGPMGATDFKGPSGDSRRVVAANLLDPAESDVAATPTIALGSNGFGNNSLAISKCQCRTLRQYMTLKLTAVFIINTY